MKQAATLLLPFLLMAPGISLTSIPQQPTLNETSQTVDLGFDAIPKKEELAAGHIPAQSLYQLLAAELALDREQMDVALVNYIAAAKETQDPAIAARATQIALSIASLETAIEPAQIWAQTDKNNLEAQVTTAALYIRLNQISQAVPYLVRSEKINAQEAFQYFLILFKQLQKEEDSARVIQALQQVAKQEIQDKAALKDLKELSAHLALTEIYLFQKEDALALKTSKETLEYTPNSVLAIQLYTESLGRTEGKAAAKTFLDKTASEQSDPLLKQYYAQFLLENGYSNEARKEVEILIKNPNLTAQELLQFSRMSMQAHWFDIAEKALMRASAFPESKDLAHYFLARVAEMQNHETVAIEWFKQVLTGPFHVLSQVRASVLLSEKGKYNEAIQILSHTQPTDMNDSKQILLAMVDVLNQSKNYDQSLVLLDKEMKQMPDDIELLYARSLVEENLGKTDLAEKDLKQILSLQPNHLDALNTLGYILANKTDRFAEAQSYLNQALELSPDNPAILDSLGWLYYKKGDYAKSIEILTKANTLASDAQISAHLGEVLWKAKNYDQAKKVFNTGLKNHPQHEYLLEAMQRLMH